MAYPSFFNSYLRELTITIHAIDIDSIEKVVDGLVGLRKQGGRLAVLGVGGSAANASHFTNDLRKLAHIDAYCPTDNISEVTARTNDEGFDTVFVEWLKTSHWSTNDAIFVLSVGGGSITPPVSIGLIRAIDYALAHDAKVFGIVGREQGYTARHGDAVIRIPNLAPKMITPFTEAIQAVIWHGLVSHPSLKAMPTKW